MKKPIEVKKSLACAAAVFASVAFATDYTDDTTIDSASDLPADGIFNVAKNKTVAVNVGIGDVDGGTPLKVIKRGAGRVNFNAANTFSGDLVLEEGYLTINHKDALGAGKVIFDTDGTRQLALNVKDAVFTNDFYVYGGMNSTSTGVSGPTTAYSFSDLVFVQPCTLTGNITPSFTSRIGGTHFFSIGGWAEGFDPLKGTVTFEGDLEFSKINKTYFRIVPYGRFDFKGFVKAQNFIMRGQSSATGEAWFYSSENNLGSGNPVVARAPTLHCGAANVLGNLCWRPYESSSVRPLNIYLNGYDQTINSILFSDTLMVVAKDADEGHFGVVSTTNRATLTINGRAAGASHACPFGFEGPLNLVLNADPTYTFIQTNRLNQMTGTLIVSNGIFRIGARDSFAKAGELRVEDGARLEVATELVQAFAGCTNFLLNGTCVVTDNDQSPFAVETAALTLGPNASLSLPTDAELSVVSLKTVSADGEVVEHGPGFYGPGGKLSNLIKSGRVKVPATVKTTATWTGLGADTGIATGENWTTSPDAPDLELGSLNAVFASGGEVATVDRKVSLNGLSFAPVTGTTGFTLADGGGSLTVGEGGLAITAADDGVSRSYTVEPHLKLMTGADLAFEVPAGDALTLAGGVDALAKITPTGGTLEIGGVSLLEERLVVKNMNFVLSGKVEASDKTYRTADLRANTGETIIYTTVEMDATTSKPKSTLALTNAVIDKGWYVQGPNTAASVVWFTAAGTNAFMQSAFLRQTGCLNVATNSQVSFEAGFGGNGAVVLKGAGDSTVIVSNRPIFALTSAGVRLHGNVELRLAAAENVFSASAPLTPYQGANNIVRFCCDYALRNAGFNPTCTDSGQRVEFGNTKQHVASMSATSYTCVFNGEPGSELQVASGTLSASVTGALSIRKTGDSSKLTISDNGNHPVPRTSAGDLTVEGGDLILASNVTWQNGTNVTAKGSGRLVVNSATAFNKKLTVMRLEDEGVLELANTGKVYVKELWLDGERIAPGTYGAAIASTPAKLKAHLDGEGAIRVCDGGLTIIVR